MTAPFPSKRQVLERLSHEELAAAANIYGIDVADRDGRSGFVDALVQSNGADLAALLLRLPRERLKGLCVELGLDEMGRDKATFIGRLVPRAGSTNAARSAKPSHT